MLAFAEGVLLAVPAVVAAPWLAVLSLQALNHVGPLAEVGLELEPQVGTTSYVLAALAGLLCAGGLALPALRSASVTAAVQEQGRPRAKGIIQRAGVDIALVVLAALAYWQLRRYQGPVVESIQGRFGIDPLLVAAPALGLLAGALLALRVVPALGSLVERMAVSGRGLVAPLGTRQLARRPSRYARAAVLLTLALAIGLFASAYSSTWLRSQEDRAAFDAAADVRVLPDERTGAVPALGLAGAYASIDGVQEALPVVERPLDLPGGAEPARLLALDTERAPALVHVRPDLLGGGSLEEAMAPLASRRPELASIELPGEPARIEVDASASVESLEDSVGAFGFPREAEPPTIAFVLRDANGLLHRVFAGELEDDGETHRLQAELAGTPEEARPAYPLSLVAVELGIDAVQGDSRRGTLTLEGLSTDEGPVDPTDARWTVTAPHLGNAFAAPEVIGVRTGGSGLPAFDFSTGAGQNADAAVAFPIAPGQSEAPQTVPALVTSGFLERTGTDVGGTVSLGPDDPGLELVGTVRDFPTISPDAGGAVVDLPTYAAAVYLHTGAVSNPTEWLLDAGPGSEEAVADALEAPPFSSASVVDRVGAEERLTRDPVALGISGALSLGFVAAAIFAIVGFAVAAAVSTAERTTEFAVLRSLGLSGRQLSGWLALEGALTAVFALVAGLALGALVAWLVLPFVSLAGEGGRPFPDVIVELPWQAIAILAGGLALALLVVLTVQLLLLRRLSLTSALRAGEVR
jgi:FtsX-like permease family protein